MYPNRAHLSVFLCPGNLHLKMKKEKKRKEKKEKEGGGKGTKRKQVHSCCPYTHWSMVK